jgi:hypothetical protein
MRLLTALLFLSVELGGAFGAASAEVVSQDDESMTIELQVEVDGEVDAVVAQLALTGEEPLALPLIDRGDGTFGITTEVRPADYQVVFEVLGEVSSQSQPVALSDLGIEFDDGGGGTTEDEGLSSDTIGWGWLAVAFGAASLAALAFWVLGGRDEAEEEVEPTSETDEPEQQPEEALAQTSSDAGSDSVSEDS